MTEQRWIIPENLFVGMPRSVRGHTPIAHMTGAGTDSGAKGRMQTVTTNSSQTWQMPNTPQWGVTLGGASWKDEIRVEDPRGFAVNVRMESVMRTLRECTVVNGVIQASCVWARSAGQNVLLAVGTETHELATIQTRLANSKVSLKTVQLGDWVTLTNGVQGVYLGKYYNLSFEGGSWIRSSHSNKLQVDDTARVIVWQPHIKRSWRPTHTNCMMFLTNPVVAEHVSHDEVYTESQAECLVNQLLQDDTCSVQRNSRSYYSERVLFVSRKPIHIEKVQLHHEAIVYTDADEINRLRHKVHWSPDGESFWMWANQNRQSSVSLYEWDHAAIKQHKLHFKRAAPTSNTPLSRTMDAAQVMSDLYVFKVSYTTTLGNQVVTMV